ncbi:MAG: hypothetical protein OEZ13_03840 [Spirochaetia bacterium]|nr:hypothetical protein [Spirochaetia bacterium]
MNQIEFDIKAYEYTTRTYIQFLIETHQWEPLGIDDINSWLENFGDQIGRYYGLRILVNCSYYSEKHLIRLLRKGLHDELIYREIMANIDIEKALNYPLTFYNSKAYDYLGKTIFIPLLHSDVPSESGYWLVRTLVTQQIIHQHNQTYPTDLDKIKNYENIIIVDDCIGTGEHIRDFINSNVYKELKNLGKKIIFLVAVGAKEGVKCIEKMNVDIRCIEVLDENRRIFGNHGNVWKDDEERCAAIDYFKEVEKNRGVTMLGYKKMDYAMIVQNNIPNWSLPILWKETADWQPLIRRKSS